MITIHQASLVKLFNLCILALPASTYSMYKVTRMSAKYAAQQKSAQEKKKKNKCSICLVKHNHTSVSLPCFVDHRYHSQCLAPVTRQESPLCPDCREPIPQSLHSPIKKLAKLTQSQNYKKEKLKSERNKYQKEVTRLIQVKSMQVNQENNRLTQQLEQRIEENHVLAESNSILQNHLYVSIGAGLASVVLLNFLNIQLQSMHC